MMMMMLGFLELASIIYLTFPVRYLQLLKEISKAQYVSFFFFSFTNALSFFGLKKYKAMWVYGRW